MFKKLSDRFYNPIDSKLSALAKSGKKRVLVYWNRGLGDIPLGLCAFVHRARELVEDVDITFATRPDLAELFSLIQGVNVVISTDMVRGRRIKPIVHEPYDLVFTKLDPTRHLSWQIGSFTPKLYWDPSHDHLADAFGLDPNKTYLAAHVNSETGHYYGYEKNWPIKKWQALLKKIDVEVILFGLRADDSFPGCIDLRGKTSLLGMLSIIKNRCRYLVAPDSGVLSVLYYLDAPFATRVVSLWSDSRQGVLRQNVDSPDRLLEHIPLISDPLEKLSVESVYEALFAKSD